MEKAVKQRLLGGVVLIAGTALFLPMLLDGSGAPLTVPPMPPAPTVPGVEAIAPKLDAKVQAADQAVDAAHPPEAAVDGEASTEQDVAPDAAAPVEPVATPAAKPAPAVFAQERVAQEKTAQEKAAAAKAELAAQKARDEKAKAEKAAADAKAVADAKAAQQKQAALEAAAKEKAAQEKAAQEKLAQAKAKQLEAKQATPIKSPVSEAAATALPEAWVVQVASLSSQAKADELVKKLRQKNYRAVVHQQGSVWKVVVGPELRKEVAESVKARLAADPDLKLSGWVQAYKP